MSFVRHYLLSYVFLWRCIAFQNHLLLSSYCFHSETQTNKVLTLPLWSVIRRSPFKDLRRRFVQIVWSSPHPWDISELLFTKKNYRYRILNDKHRVKFNLHFSW